MTLRRALAPLLAAALVLGLLGTDGPVAAQDESGLPSSGGPTVSPSIEPRATNLPPGTIRFNEYPTGTRIRNQYIDRGIQFVGPRVFITTDSANSNSPVLSGIPRFAGNIRGRFVRPGTTNARTVDYFALNVGYINDPGQVRVAVFGRGGNQLGVFVPRRRGVVRVTSRIRNVAAFVVRVSGGEAAGSAIDNLVHPGINFRTGNLLNNPSFELNNTNAHWKRINHAANVRSANYAGTVPHGRRFAQFNTTRAEGSFGQDVAFAPRTGDLIRATVWVRNPGCSRRFRGTLAIWVRGGASQYNTTWPFNVACGPWRQIQLQLRARANHSSLRFEVYATSLNKNISLDHAGLSVTRAN